MFGGNLTTESDILHIDLAVALVNGADLSVDAFLLNGADTLDAPVNLQNFDLDSTSTARWSVQGGGGNDILTLDQINNGTAATDVVGYWSISLDGGTGDDELTIGLDGGTIDVDGGTGGLDGVNILASGGAGNDTIDVGLSKDADSVGNINLGLLGGRNDDTITFTFVDACTLGGESFGMNGANGQLLADGGLGTDSFTLNGSGAGFEAASVHQRNFEAAPIVYVPRSVTQGDFDGNGSTDLRIVGDDQKQIVTIVVHAVANTTTIQFDANGDGDLNDAKDFNQDVNAVFETFDLRLLGGADHVSLVLADSPDFGRLASLLIDLGSAADTCTIELGTISVLLTVDVAGGGGGDHVQLLADNLSNSSVFAQLDLGGGNDSNSGINLGQFGSSQVAVQAAVDLGAGTNTFDVGFGLMISGGFIDYDVRGGADPLRRDVVNLTLDTADAGMFVGGQVDFDALLLDGNDRFNGTVNLDKVDFGNRFAISAHGGAGKDNLSFSRDGTLGTGSSELFGTLAVILNGQAGNDQLALDLGELNVASTFDLGSTLRIRGNGGAGNDTVDIRYRADTTSSGAVDLVVTGGAGFDEFSGFIVHDSGSTISLVPGGFVLLDKGLGADSFAGIVFVFVSGAIKQFE